MNTIKFTVSVVLLFFFSAFGIGKLLKVISDKYNLYEISADGEKVQKLLGYIVPITLLVNILISDTLIYTFGDFNALGSIKEHIYLGMGILYFSLLGYMYDTREVLSKKKIWYLILGILILTTFSNSVNVLGNFNINHIAAFALTMIITLLWYFICITSMNFIRSYKRLADGTIFIMSMGTLILALVNNNIELILFSVMLLGVSATLMKFKVNTNNITAKLYGFVFAFIMANYYICDIKTLIIAAVIIAMPIMNLKTVIVSRIIKGTTLTVRDRSHLYTRLEEGGYTKCQILSLLYSVEGLCVIVSLIASITNNLWFLAMSLIGIIVLQICIAKIPEKQGKVTVMSVFGTRPEAIKMAPLIKELEKNPDINSVVCVTGQHKEMLYQVLDIFKIKPDYDLNIMKKGQSLVGISARILNTLEKVVKRVKPDLILVHGDTTSTFIGALAAFDMQVKVGHVEAGLRTYNKKEPFPEEMNRVLTGQLADFHFAPSSLAKENLLKEGIKEEQLYLTGNTVVDAVQYTYKEEYIFKEKALNKIDYKNKKVVLMTAHRRENIGLPLDNICMAVLELVTKNEDVEVIYAVHKNPAVRKIVYGRLGDNSRIHLVEPLDVCDMHNVMKRSYIMLTDSGGLQEEAPSFNLPTFVLRNVTERPEGLETGILRLVGTDRVKIIEEVTKVLNDKDEHKKMSESVNPYGDGSASKRIKNAILYAYGLRTGRPDEFKWK